MNDMFKKAVVTCALVFATPMLSATEEPQTAEQAATAQHQLKLKLAELNTFSAHFNQTVLNANEEVLQTAQGTISLKQPDKLFWDVAEPNENTLIADGETLWHIDPFVEQVVAIKQDAAIANNPIMLLTSPDSEAWNDFQISTQEDGFVVSSNSDDSQIVSLELNFTGKQLKKLSFTDRQGQKSVLVFEQIKQNITLADEAFVFTLPEGFELDDQRL